MGGSAIIDLLIAITMTILVGALSFLVFVLVVTLTLATFLDSQAEDRNTRHGSLNEQDHPLGRGDRNPHWCDVLLDQS